MLYCIVVPEYDIIIGDHPIRIRKNEQGCGIGVKTSNIRDNKGNIGIRL